MVVGSRGFIGSRLVTIAAHRVELCGDDDLDITSTPGVAQAFNAYRPDAVILLAAISDIDRCEREPELAQMVNVGGVVNVAAACAEHGARLVFASTGAVYDGTKHGYMEDDRPNPLSVYGRTKVEAENRIAEIVQRPVIVRLSLVVGAALRPGTNSLTDKLVESFRAGRQVYAPADEYRNPIDVFTLSEFLIRFAADSSSSGIFHIGAADCISRYELAKRVAVKRGYSSDLVVPGGSGAPGRAPRGKHQFLISEKAAAVCGIPLPTVEQILERLAYVPA